MESTEHSGGFTLIEAFISIMVVALVLGGAYPVVSRSGMLIRSARNHYLAVNIAKDRLERCRDYDYTTLSFLTETNLLVDDNGVPTTSGVFRRSTSVAVNYNGQTGLTLIAVTAEIRDLLSGQFKGEQESASCLYTSYLSVQ